MNYQVDVRFWIGSVAASALLHGVLMGSIAAVDEPQEQRAKPVRIKIVTQRAEPAPEPPPQPPPPRPKPKPPERSIASERKPRQKRDSKDVKPVFGAKKPVTAPKAKSLSPPLGNTLLKEDDGKRVNDPPPPLDVDLSEEARLIHETMIPPAYTDAAFNAGFEGDILVNVFVDRDGRVQDARLVDRVRYGMGRRILAAIRNARFEPQKNRIGVPVDGWTQIKFRLQIR